MLLLVVASEFGGDKRNVLARKFPFTIGRSPTADLCIDAPGVWDSHAAISVGPSGFELAPIGEALVLLNDESFSGGHLRAGDRLSLGAAHVIITLAPAEQHALGVTETLIWVLIYSLCVVEVLLLLTF